MIILEKKIKKNTLFYIELKSNHSLYVKKKIGVNRKYSKNEKIMPLNSDHVIIISFLVLTLYLNEKYNYFNF